MKILSFTKKDWPIIVFGTVSLTLCSVGESFIPLILGKIVSAIVVQDVDKISSNILTMALVSVGAAFFGGLRSGTFQWLCYKTTFRIQQAFFDSITSQEIAFFDENKTGDIMSRLISDTTTLGNCLGLNVNIFLRTIIKVVGACVFMFSLSWRMALLTMMSIPLIYAVSTIYGYYYEEIQKEIQNKIAKSNEVANEVFSTMQTVRSFANEKQERVRYGEKLDDTCNSVLKQSFFNAVFVWGTNLLQLVPRILILIYGRFLIAQGLLISESFVSFIFYQQQVNDSFTDIADVYTGIMQALGAADKVFDLIERKPKINLDEGKFTAEKINGSIKFENVSFTYPTRPEEPIIQDISFEAKPGEVIALVGPSGGGKSSCVKLLKRFYTATSGDILLDGKPIRDYKHDFFHRVVTMVGQEPVLYARSIKDNIRYGLDDVTDHVIVESARQANAHDFITSLDQQYDTEAGEKGAQLSGGQKQRIAIARSLVRKPNILLLDEATSALDTESEFLVQQALERNKEGRTVILIAHRLSTVKSADRIVVIMKGKVVECGSHKHLMDKRGIYYNLVYRQLKPDDISGNNSISS